MAYIAERVFVEGGNTRLLALNNAEYVRKLHIGNDWQQILVGLLCAVQGNGTTGNRVMQWGLGMCADMSGLSPMSTKHWIGSYATTSTMTYTANTGNPYYVLQPTFARKVGTVVTTAGVGTIQFNFPIIADGTMRKTPLWLSVTRTSTAVYTVQNFTMTGATGMATDYSLNDLTESMEQVGVTPSARGNSFAAGTGNTLNGSDLDGMLNTVSIYWGSNLFPLEIYGLAVYRVR